MAQVTPLPKAEAVLIRRLLREKTTRDHEGVFVLEGEKPIRELLREPAGNIRAVVMTPEYLQRVGQGLLKTLTEQPSSAYLCPKPLFARLSDVHTSQGLLAVIHKPVWDEAAVLSRRRLFGLYGERLQDPANVGSMIRSALALGVDAVWLSTDSADPFGPKVARATAGTILKLPMFSATDATVFVRHRCSVFAAEPAGQMSRDLRSIHTLPERLVLALGNESQGLSDTTLKSAAVRFHIRTNSKVESLNVAAAAAICLFHFRGLVQNEPGR